ncbi:hypothetical protein DIZ27_05160 [Streptomyces sp. NWU339]|uniref:hypothetical protein n=1 Tax=Streptomyces sp. NWU339 TaxID=2185284 RepID=UPI000D6761EA|nr:hypothetical protein [Streptomyces sp. NWU339]PWI11436.1 hypothetical protein DIZ27_05160 [Streptomyces sp. NWU339]
MPEQTHPFLGAPLTEADVLALTGADATAVERHVLSGTEVLSGPEGAVFTVEAGDQPGRSGVWNADEIRLVGPASEPVVALLRWNPWRGEHPPLHFAVRTPQDTLYLGKGYAGQYGRLDSAFIDARIRPLTSLPRVLLDRARPPLPPVELPGLAWLDHVNGDRAKALELFVTAWHPVENPEETLRPEASVPSLPTALRHFYRLAVGRPQVLGRQNHIRPAGILRVDDAGEMIILGHENQGGFRWLLRWTLDDSEPDPTVWYDEDGETLVPEAEPLSGFLLQFCLFEAALCSAYRGWAHPMAAAEVAQLTAPLREVPLHPFRPGTRTRFFVAPGLVAAIGDGWENGTFDVTVGATHRQALAPLVDVPVTWSGFDG